MNDWQVLGIDPTDDRVELKRAYNRRLREHPPEKDPTGFMRLRAAYERLLESIESRRSMEEDSVEDNMCRDGSDAPEEDPSLPEGPPPEKPPPAKWHWSQRSWLDPEPSRGLGTSHWHRPPLPVTLGAQEDQAPRKTWTFAPGSAKSVTFSGDHEVHALWLAFRELWGVHRADPDDVGWIDLIDLLEMDRTFRRLFSKRLAAFFEECFSDGNWRDVSPVLLWRLAVALGWDADPSPTEAIVGRPIGETLVSWRYSAAVDSLARRFRILWKQWGGKHARQWDDFFALAGSDPRLRREFEPVGQELLRELAPAPVIGDTSTWVKTKLDDIAYLNTLKPPTPPPAPRPSHLGPIPVEQLQPQDRSLLWAIGGGVLVFVAFLGYQIAMRVLGR